MDYGAKMVTGFASDRAIPTVAHDLVAKPRTLAGQR
jgi:hypothetical protein